jgi:hypothetical protein
VSPCVSFSFGCYPSRCRFRSDGGGHPDQLDRFGDVGVGRSHGDSGGGAPPTLGSVAARRGRDAARLVRTDHSVRRGHPEFHVDVVQSGGRRAQPPADPQSGNLRQQYEDSRHRIRPIHKQRNILRPRQTATVDNNVRPGRVAISIYPAQWSGHPQHIIRHLQQDRCLEMGHQRTEI